MHYALLIRADGEAAAKLSSEELIAVGAGVDAFDAELTKAGKNLGSVRLQDTDAVTLRTEDGQVITTDGPFAESKEQVGGIYLIDAEDGAEAVAIARKLPTLRFCSIEVRPVEGIDLRGKVGAAR